MHNQPINEIASMIDTIVLLLSPNTYTISDPSKFTPSAQWALANTIIPGLRSKQNPTKKELHAGIYKPRLTLEHRMGIHARRSENMLKSDKRAIEKDNALQLKLFERLRSNKKFEILRMEVRLNKRAKINKFFIRSKSCQNAWQTNQCLLGF